MAQARQQLLARNIIPMIHNVLDNHKLTALKHRSRTTAFIPASTRLRNWTLILTGIVDNIQPYKANSIRAALRARVLTAMGIPADQQNNGVYDTLKVEVVFSPAAKGGLKTTWVPVEKVIVSCLTDEAGAVFFSSPEASAEAPVANMGAVKEEEQVESDPDPAATPGAFKRPSKIAAGLPADPASKPEGVSTRRSVIKVSTGTESKPVVQKPEPPTPPQRRDHPFYEPERYVKLHGKTANQIQKRLTQGHVVRFHSGSIGRVTIRTGIILSTKGNTAQIMVKGRKIINTSYRSIKTIIGDVTRFL